MPDTEQEAGVVHAMVNRPVAEVASFLERLATTWLRGLFDPWGLGVAARDDPSRLAPPFAFLVVTLFGAVVARRMLWALGLLVSGAESLDAAALLSDLRVAMGELSVYDATLVVLPAVLVTVLAVRPIGWLLGDRESLFDDPLVRVACYAMGWMSGAIVVVAAGLLGVFLLGTAFPSDATGALNRALPPIAVVVLVWGGIVFAPTLHRRAPGPDPLRALVAGMLGCLLACPLLVGGYWTLGATSDLSSAARRAIDRQLDLYVGPLQVNVLEHRDTAPSRAELVIAYTNRAEQEIIVPQQREFRAPQDAHERFDGGGMLVLDSSIDSLPDRALVIAPGETRVAHYTVVPLAGADPGARQPFAVVFHRRHPDGAFTAREVVFWSSDLEGSRLEANRANGAPLR